jgi:hypothetical protein
VDCASCFVDCKKVGEGTPHIDADRPGHMPLLKDSPNAKYSRVVLAGVSRGKAEAVCKTGYSPAGSCHLAQSYDRRGGEPQPPGS